jgi:tetratricopeptide (TPR) repeat protein
VDSLPDLDSPPETYYLGGAAYLEKGDRLKKSGAAGAEAAYRRSRELLERSIRINQAIERHVNAPGVVGRTKLEAYRLLADALARLGDLDGALRTAREAQRFAPLDADLYNQIADLLLQRQQGNEAAVALTEGMLITSNPGLRANLLVLYGSSKDPANCTLVRGANPPEINPRCDIVADHMCAAAPVVLQSLMDMGRRQEAAEKEQMFVRDYRCAAAALDAIAPR